MKKLIILAAAIGALAGPPAQAATNIMPTAVTFIGGYGKIGKLPAGSEWADGASLAPMETLWDGVFLPRNTQWNAGTVWWDEDPAVNRRWVEIHFLLDQVYALNRFVLQGDGNDLYKVDYWDGADWQSGWAAKPMTFTGLATRDSGDLPTITTNELRISGLAYDRHFSLSEFQAFGAPVPEPEAWTLLILGFGAAGAAFRRRRRGLGDVKTVPHA